MNENIKAKKRNNEKVYLTEANINKLKGLDKERKYQMVRFNFSLLV